MINIEDLRFTIEQIDSVHYSLCNIDTLVRVEDMRVYSCSGCVFREAVDESNIICPHKVIANGDDVIK